MPTHIGKQAVVAGAGIAGLIASRSLSDFFERVIVLESDPLRSKQHTDREPRNRGTSMAFWQAAYRY
jgi:flavin-dependent dehydrogenase